MKKQKMVIEVPMNGLKARSKVLKLAVSITGVESAKVNDMNQIEVVGKGVDPINLTQLLREKLSNGPHLPCLFHQPKLAYAELVSFADVETKSKPKAEETNQNPIVWQCPPPSIPPCVCFHEDPSPCSIL